MIIVMLAFAFTQVTQVDFYEQWDYTLYYLIALHAFTLVLPLFGMSYRYSLRKSDLYRQVAIKNRSIRIADNLILFLMLVAAFLITYPILFSLVISKDLTEHSQRIAYNHIYLVPQFFFVLVSMALTYGFSYCIISFTNHFVSSVVLLTASQFVVGAITATMVYAFSKGEYFGLDFWLIPFLFPVMVSNKTFGSLIVEDRVVLEELLNNEYYVSNFACALHVIQFIAVLIVFVGVGIFGLVKLFAINDPSAEWAGKPGSKSIIPIVIYHACFAGVFTYLFRGMTEWLSGSVIATGFIVTSILIAGYYTLYGLFKLNFKLNKNEVITMCSVLGGSLFLGLILSAIR